MVAGSRAANRMSNNGAPPLNQTSVATTVVVCPTWQQGPAGGMPVSAPAIQVPGDTQVALTEHGRVASLLHTRVVRGPPLNCGREHPSLFLSANLALVVPVVRLRMELNWVTKMSSPSNAPSGSGQPSKS